MSSRGSSSSNRVSRREGPLPAEVLDRRAASRRRRPGSRGRGPAGGTWSPGPQVEDLLLRPERARACASMPRLERDGRPSSGSATSASRFTARSLDRKTASAEQRPARRRTSTRIRGDPASNVERHGVAVDHAVLEVEVAEVRERVVERLRQPRRHVRRHLPHVADHVGEPPGHHQADRADRRPSRARSASRTAAPGRRPAAAPGRSRRRPSAARGPAARRVATASAYSPAAMTAMLTSSVNAEAQRTCPRRTPRAPSGLASSG